MEASPTPPSFDRYGPDEPVSPVVVSVPHAGRQYPAAMQALLTVPVARLTALEDRHVDAVAMQAVEREVLFVARRARGWIDLNRSPLRDRDPQVDAGADPRGFAAQASDKVRSGIGLIPRRAGGADNMWRRKLSDAEVTARIAQDHAPYHAALDGALASARARFGVALLLDLHSMPPLPGVVPAQVVLGNRHGHSCASLFTDTAAAIVHETELRVAINYPYAGGHILASHARPRAGIHALQLEIDRSLYLDEEFDQPGNVVATTVAWVRAMIDALAEVALSTTHRIAAE